MGTERAQRGFIYLVLAVATVLAALEVRGARGGDPSPRPVTPTPWVSPLAEMDEAISKGDLMTAAAARHEAYRAAIASRSWEGFLAAGDAVIRLGDATQSRPAAEPDARRLYLAALFRARGQCSLDGVLQATEAFARLGDDDVVSQGLQFARDLAGSDPEAQARVRLVTDRAYREATAMGESDEQGL